MSLEVSGNHIKAKGYFLLHILFNALKKCAYFL